MGITDEHTDMRNWQDLAWPDFATLPADTIAILPVAAIEQHGPHLPLSTDADINAGLLDRLGTLLPPDAPVLRLPMQSVGLSVEHVRFPGTLTFQAEQLLACWAALGEGVARAGVRRLLVVNSHGGQPQIVDLLCRRMRAIGVLAAHCTWFRLGLPPGLVDADEERFGIHGGKVETSLMLRLRPDLVRRERIADFRNAWQDRAADFSILDPEGAVGFGWETQDLHAEGALGDARAASAAIGEAILAHVAARLATLVAEMRNFEPDEFFREFGMD